MSQKPHILILEDDEAIRLLLLHHLQEAGYQLSLCETAEEAYLLLQEHQIDLLISDWMLPDFSGVELIMRLRKKKELASLPIILLTARGAEGDRIHGLSMGADDYLPKPFSVPELIARINALLRRTKSTLVSVCLTYDDVILKRADHQVERAGKEVHLGPKEYQLLEFFMQTPHRVFSRFQLLDAVWGQDCFIDERTIDVHILRLRKALNQFGGKNLIRTIRGFGYAFGQAKR